MQAVLLAAGSSTRTQPLTLTRPKPLLKVANKTILKHNIEQLEGLVEEIIIVVGYKKEMIEEHLKNYTKTKITFVEQKEQLGTAHALLQAKSHITQNFLFMVGDDLLSKEDLTKLLKYDWAVLAKKVENPENFGIFELDEEQNITNVEEKPNNPKSNLANTACYMFQKEVLENLETLPKTERGEYEATDALNIIAKTHKVKCIQAQNWIPITFPWSLLEANEFLLSKLKGENKGTIEPNTRIKGEVFIDTGTIIKSGAYIKGPVYIGKNCNIGPNCYIRPSTTIGNNCKVGNAVELKNSILFDNTSVGHLSYVGDSVLGYKVNFGAGTITANLRYDNKNVKTPVKDTIIDTGRRKLGTIIGDNVHTGIHTSIYPGRKLWPNTSTPPGAIVNKDVTE